MFKWFSRLFCDHYEIQKGSYVMPPFEVDYYKCPKCGLYASDHYMNSPIKRHKFKRLCKLEESKKLVILGKEEILYTGYTGQSGYGLYSYKKYKRNLLKRLFCKHDNHTKDRWAEPNGNEYTVCYCTICGKIKNMNKLYSEEK